MAVATHSVDARTNRMTARLLLDFSIPSFPFEFFQPNKLVLRNKTFFYIIFDTFKGFRVLSVIEIRNHSFATRLTIKAKIKNTSLKKK